MAPKKKPPPRKTAAAKKKTAAKKPAAKKPAAKRKTAAKKTAARKSAARRNATSEPDAQAILMEVSLEFGRNCPRPLSTAAKARFRDLFDRTIAAGIASGRVTYWNTRSRIYVFRHVKRIAREVYAASEGDGAVSDKLLFKVADPYIRSAQRRALVALRRARSRADRARATRALRNAVEWKEIQTSFCDAYQ